MSGAGGFFTIHRKVLDSWIWRLSPAGFKVFVYTLSTARWQEEAQRIPAGGKFLVVERGQLLTSAREVAEKAAIDRRTVLKTWAMMELDGMIEIDRAMHHKKSLITVCNYDLYQSLKAEGGPEHAPEHVPTHVPDLLLEPSNQVTKPQAPPGGEIVDNSRAAVFQLWEETKPGAIVSSREMQLLDQLLNVWPGQLVLDAINKAALAGKPFLSYVEGILQGRGQKPAYGDQGPPARSEPRDPDEGIEVLGKAPAKTPTTSELTSWAKGLPK